MTRNISTDIHIGSDSPLAIANGLGSFAALSKNKFDSFDEILQLESNFDSSQCIAVDSSKSNHFPIFTYLTKPTQTPEFKLPTTQHLILATSANILRWSGRKIMASGEPSMFFVLSNTLIIANGTNGSDNIKLSTPPLLKSQIHVTGLPNSPGFENTIELKIAGCALIIVQTPSRDSYQSLLDTLSASGPRARKEKQNVEQIVIELPTMQRPEDKAFVEEAKQNIVAIQSRENPANNSEQEQPSASVGEIRSKDLCQPYVKKLLNDGSFEWEKLPKSFALIVTDTDGMRPRFILMNQTTGRPISSVGISASTLAVSSESKGVLIQSNPTGSTNIRPYLVRFKDAPTRDKFIELIKDCACICAIWLAESFKDKLFLEPHHELNNLPTLLWTYCPSLSVHFSTSDENRLPPLDFGPVIIKVRGDSMADSLPGEENGHHIIEVCSPAREDQYFLKSGLLDSNFKLEVAGFSPVETRDRSADSSNLGACDRESLVSSRNSTIRAPSTPVCPVLTLEFKMGAWKRRYKLTFNSQNTHEEEKAIATLVELLNRKFHPFQNAAVENAEAAETVEPIEPVDMEIALSAESEWNLTLAESYMGCENKMSEIEPSPKLPGLRASRLIRSTGDLASASISISRGVTGWVAERVAYFNELARRTAAASVYNRPIGKLEKPKRSKVVLARWKHAIETSGDVELSKSPSLVKILPSKLTPGLRPRWGTPEQSEVNKKEFVFSSDEGDTEQGKIATQILPADLEAIPLISSESVTTLHEIAVVESANDLKDSETGESKEILEDIITKDSKCAESPIVDGCIEDTCTSSDKSASVDIILELKDQQCEEVKNDNVAIEKDRKIVQSFASLPHRVESAIVENNQDFNHHNSEIGPPKTTSLAKSFMDPAEFESVAPWNEVAIVLGENMTREKYETIVRIVLEYEPFTGGPDDVDEYLSNRWYGGENETRPKLEPSKEFPDEVLEDWEEIPYAIQNILLNSGYQSTVKAKVAQTWLRVDRANLLKYRPTYINSRPKHLQTSDDL
ncbi:hypothetical protein HDU97_006052 [Phlyctochytrium planicorne]|nr:hypothetical protein HDU97_006052 [Phlyctochytrium planicorne]